LSRMVCPRHRCVSLNEIRDRRPIPGGISQPLDALDHKSVIIEGNESLPPYLKRWFADLLRPDRGQKKQHTACLIISHGERSFHSDATFPKSCRSDQHPTSWPAPLVWCHPKCHTVLAVVTHQRDSPSGQGSHRIQQVAQPAVPCWAVPRPRNRTGPSAPYTAPCCTSLVSGLVRTQT